MRETPTIQQDILPAPAAGIVDAQNRGSTDGIASGEICPTSPPEPDGACEVAREFAIQRFFLMVSLDADLIDIDGAIEQLTSDFEGLTAVDALDMLLPDDSIQALSEFDPHFSRPVETTGFCPTVNTTGCTKRTTGRPCRISIPADAPSDYVDPGESAESIMEHQSLQAL